MTLQTTDLRLLASERMTQQADAGGGMTDVVVGAAPTGALALPVVTDLDRVDGAVDIAKLWVANTAAGTDALYGAHAFIDSLPDDPAISNLLYLPVSTGTAGGVSETVDHMMASANSDASSSISRWYSITPLSAAASENDTSVTVASVQQPLIPAWSSPSEVSGTIVVLDGGLTTRTALIQGVGTQTAVGNADGDLVFPAQPMPGTLTGVGGHAITTAAAPSGFESMLDGGMVRGLIAPVHTGAWVLEAQGVAYSDGATVAEFVPALVTDLPCDIELFTAHAGGNYVFSLTYEPEVGSELLFGGVGRYVNVGPEAGWQASALASPSLPAVVGFTVDRAAKTMTATGLTVGATWCIAYVRKGLALAVPAWDVSATFSGGSATITLGAAYELAWARFSVDGVDCAVEGTMVLKGGFPLGSFNPASGVMSLAVPDGTPIEGWLAVKRLKVMPEMLRPASLAVVNAPLPVGLNPASLHITGEQSNGDAFELVPDASGAISDSVATGNYGPGSGLLNLNFLVPIRTDGVAYSAAHSAYVLAASSVARFDSTVFGDSGAVPVIRSGDAVVVHHTVDFGPVVVSNGQTVDVSTTGLSHLWVFGADGQEINAGFSVDLAAGHVAFTATSGYSQPVTLRKRWEDSARVMSISGGRISLSRRLAHDYPAGACISAVAPLGDLDAAVHDPWAMTFFDNPMSDTPTNPGDTPYTFNAAAWPITTTCAGAITQRWGLQVMTPGVVRVIGDTVGDVGQFSMSGPVAPVNPATGAPYFSVPPEGWGGSWPGGATLRFNTSGAQRHVYLVRATAPSDPSTAGGSASIAFRGNAAAE